jgi:hypothetical protein
MKLTLSNGTEDNNLESTEMNALCNSVFLKS